MAIQGLNFTILTGTEGHQSYQATGSFIVYNPNDGVAFIATDRTATGLSWDYKVPSQSGGKFPGPVNSYLSIFYLDQSGGGAPGQVVVYASPEIVNIPYFWSIGRATQLQSTSLDIVGGPQPGNPGAGIGRLWIDTGGHLNILQPSGTNYQVLDSTNYVSLITMTGDVLGPLNNTSIHLRNASTINAIGTDGVDRVWLRINPGGTNTQFFSPQNGPFQWYTQNGGAQLLNLDTSGNLTVFGNGIVNGTFAVANTTYANGGLTVVNDIRSYRSAAPNTGVLYFTQSSGSVYLYYDGATFQFNGGNVNIPNTLIAAVHQFQNAYTLSASVGAASALPGAPALYFTVQDQNGTQRKIPAWNP